MEYLFMWLVFPVAAWSLARGQNRNVYLWAALGLVLGPFPLLILALLKSAEGADEGYH